MMLSEVHFWSVRDEILTKSTDYGSFKYYKKETNDNLLYNAKKTYCKERGIVWTPINKRPFKVKEKLKELEEYLLQDKIVTVNWEGCEVNLLLSKGLLINITVNPNTADVANITYNRQLLTKLQAECIYDGVIAGQQVACLCSDGRVLCCGGMWKEGWLVEVGPKKRMGLHQELLVVWGRASSEHPQPWSPMARDHQRANLLLYWVGARGPELLSYKKTEGEPFDVIISKVQQKSLIVIEQKVSQRGAVSVEVSTLDLSGNNLKRSCITAVPLQTQVSCCSLSKNETRLLLGCIDGSVAILDRNKGSTHIAKAAFIPTFVTWHHLGAVAMICNEKGQLQYFDSALNTVKMSFIGEENLPVSFTNLCSYFVNQPTTSAVKWGPSGVLFAFEHGPLCVLTHVEGSLGFTALSKQYLRNEDAEKAINLLLSWEWGDQCFFVLQNIVDFLLKLPMSEDVSQKLQTALGSFHSPSVPLTVDIRHKFGSQVKSLTRRFFHQLVRSKMFETAFLLAVDIGHHDLFMDLYYCAVKIGEREMAAAARAQASALLSRCSSENSCCSRSSCSQCSDSATCSSECSSPDKDKPTLPTSYASTFSQSFSDNYLATNFNNINPKTYRPVANHTFPSNLHNVDLPKVKPVFTNKIPYKPVPSNVPPLPVTASPLPQRHLSISTPSLANLPYLTNKNPLVSRPFPLSTYSSTSDLLQLTPSTHFLTPPLPIPPPTVPNITPQNPANRTQTNSIPASGKKQQAKVKFSDTVTAFIVPEVKRPVRPPPPPHITDPQKELADSLPLCHPNEDYLKDFTPVRRSDSEEPPTQSKIKVVHFGVV